MLSAIFDDANLSAIERIRLTAQLSKANAELTTATNPIHKIKAASQVNALLIRLGVTGKRPDDQQTEVSTSDEQQGATVSASKFYEFDPDRKPAQRKKDNRVAQKLEGSNIMALLFITTIIMFMIIIVKSKIEIGCAILINFFERLDARGCYFGYVCYKVE